MCSPKCISAYADVCLRSEVYAPGEKSFDSKDMLSQCNFYKYNEACPCEDSMFDISGADGADASLRHWLTQCLDHRIVDKTLESLAAEDVFTVGDLNVLRSLPRFTQLLTAVTRQKISDALDAHALPRKPLGLDEGEFPHPNSSS